MRLGEKEPSRLNARGEELVHQAKLSSINLTPASSRDDILQITDTTSEKEKDFTVVTWNINSIRSRLELLLDWLLKSSRICSTAGDKGGGC